jgi:hypothetical protein
MTKPRFVLLFLAALSAVSGAEQVGVAQAVGGFALDGARVNGNATLFAGATVETDRASSRLRLRSGARVELAPQSRARVAADGLVLEKGSGDVTGAYRVEARTLRIAPEGPAVATVKLEGDRAVLVAAANGPVRVYNHMGDLLASVRAGTALSVLPPAAGQAAEGSALTGCLMKRDGRYVLTDTATNVTVELRGGELEPQVGKRIRVEGTVFRTATPIAGASQVIRVTSVAAAEGEPCEQPAVAQPKPAAPSTAGVSTPRPPVAAGGSKVSGALIGVIVAGAGAGAAGAILALGGDDKSR